MVVAVCDAVLCVRMCVNVWLLFVYVCVILRTDDSFVMQVECTVVESLVCPVAGCPVCIYASMFV